MHGFGFICFLPQQLEVCLHIYGWLNVELEIIFDFFFFFKINRLANSKNYKNLVECPLGGMSSKICAWVLVLLLFWGVSMEVGGGGVMYFLFDSCELFNHLCVIKIWQNDVPIMMTPHGKSSPHYWPFVRESTGHCWFFHTKGLKCRALMIAWNLYC